MLRSSGALKHGHGCLAMRSPWRGVENGRRVIYPTTARNGGADENE